MNSWTHKINFKEFVQFFGEFWDKFYIFSPRAKGFVGQICTPKMPYRSWRPMKSAANGTFVPSGGRSGESYVDADE